MLLEVPERQQTRAEGDIHLYGNPHYWLDPANAKIMATTIAEKLSELDTERAGTYDQNRKAFHERVDQAMTGWKKRSASIQEKEIVAYHNAWPYLAQSTGIKVDRFLEPKPGIPPTPNQLNVLEKYCGGI